MKRPSIVWKEALADGGSDAAVSRLHLKNTDNVVMLQQPWDASLLRYRLAEQCITYKPEGLWYACGSSWIDWALANMPSMLGEYVYKIDIDKSKILSLRTVAAIQDFDQKYRAHDYIDWRAVVDKYAGIQICPYQCVVRLALYWYYSWDVASGCIWDPSVIRGVKQVFAK